MSQEMIPILVNGEWRPSKAVGEFHAENPATGTALPATYPVSSREDMLAMLEAGSEAAAALAETSGADVARLLEGIASGIEERSAELVTMAHQETGLPEAPRLRDVELPRTTDQLRQAAKAARDGSWRRPIRDEAKKIYSWFAPLGGPVVVMGPNNFPFAFNSAAGGDFAAALAAHNPVIAKANTGHPGTTKLFAEIAREAVARIKLHPASVQLAYRFPGEVGLELVSHPLVGATGFTGSKKAGLRLKAAADAVGKPIYLEMSSVNPVLVLEGALRERSDGIAEEFFASCTMGAGQFCTNPGFVIVPDSGTGRQFVEEARRRFEAAAGGVLLAKGVRQALVEAVEILQKSGAELICGGQPMPGPAYRFANTLLSVSGETFLEHAEPLQTEAFGPVALLVLSKNTHQSIEILGKLEGNLTGTVYSDTAGSDEAEYAELEPVLRHKVGRVLNDKMPTGVAVSPAMNHGGPFPATGHPGFTAVGIPTSIQRFAALHCYDNVRPNRLPAAFRQ
jgi:NADP-dependent aldehyde dehydrogenase